MKRLLLGLGLALITSAGRAADAVVIAEPEPLEYVRICDTYGVGFYYIPGTETCLKISGYIRYDIGGGAFGLTDVIDKKNYPGSPYYDRDVNDTYDMRARFQMRLNSRTETELGTLRTYAAINFDYDTTTDPDYEDYHPYDNGPTESVYDWSIEHAYIELGGFRIGTTDSLFSTFTGYAGGVLNDDVIGYGPYRTHQASFRWSNDRGFGVAVALEEGDGDIVAPFLPPEFGEPNLYTLDSYVPDVVGGIGWQGAWGGVSAVAGYDAVWEQGAIKGRVDLSPTDRLTLFAMAGWASRDDAYEDPTFEFSGIDIKDSPNYYAPWGGSWAVWAGGSFMLTDKAMLNVQASYDQMEDFALVANVAYEVVPNFVITPEIAYIDNFNDDFQKWNEYQNDQEVPTQNWGFFVRAQANFGG